MIFMDTGKIPGTGLTDSQGTARREPEEPLTVNQVIKRELESVCDPWKDMTQEEHSAYTNKLAAKLERGEPLNNKELNYLRIHAPELYLKAKRIQYKRQVLKQRLEQCRSKKEAQEVFSDMVSGISDKDPDKEALIRNYENVYQEFKKSSQYQGLPLEEKEEDQKGRKRQEGESCPAEPVWLKVEEDVSPIYELLDSLPVVDVIG